MNILIINGPNLNLLGSRETEIYGNQSFDAYMDVLKKGFPFADLTYFQSNHEGALIDKLHAATDFDGIVMNPGGLSHTSVALADAIKSIDTPVVEVHISNVHAREDYRKKLITASGCAGVISGMGLDGYRLAIVNFISK